jgi:hypothetical protein
VSAKKSVSALVKKADKIFSQYIRNRDTVTYIESVPAGYCVTCLKITPTIGTRGHCGHFIERRCKLTRYDEHNAHLQCAYCNTYQHGEQYKHSQYIKNKYGQQELDRLVDLERQYKMSGHKWTVEELEGIINYLKGH